MVRNLPTNAGAAGSILGSGRQPGEGNDNLSQYSCLENSMDTGTCRLAAAKSLQSYPTLCDPMDVAYHALRPWDVPGKGTEVGCHFLLQRIFPTQGSSLGFQHCRQTFYRLSHQGRVSLVIQIRSVAQSCPTLGSMPGLPVHHQLLEFTQTHVHRVSDAIQPAHPLSSPSSPAPNPSQHQSLFQRVNSSHEVAKALEFQL